MVPTFESLRVSEFVATLNGDNHEAILSVLRQFHRTVKKERRIALSLDSDGMNDDYHDDSDWSDDNLNELDTYSNTHAPPSKKYKKSEEWMADTASYYVPFVGTAVAKSERAEFVEGEWPTGLVKAYLINSPLALELLNVDLASGGQIHRTLLKKRKIKLSRAICKAHYLAIAELLTASIPKYKLREIASANNEDLIYNNNNHLNHIKAFTKYHLPQIFNMMNDETERGRGKLREFGGCDLLVAPALKILKYFTMISTSNARLIARYLDESLLDGVLRACLRPFYTYQKVPVNSSDDHIPNSKPPRTETILLATSLLEANDTAVNAYICTGGSKERKVKPGILFLALREGLATSHFSNETDYYDDNYNDATAFMLEKLRVSMFVGSKLTNPRLLFNLMARDPLQHLCRLSFHAPPLTHDRSFVEVLDAADNERQNLESSMTNLGIGARRLLFPLLSDPVTSPFLPNFGCEHVARSMMRLFESPNSGTGLRHFLLHCTQENPSLIQEVFKLFAIPDPKNTFDFISRASFITLLQSKGPSPISCLHSMKKRRKVDILDILLILLPIKLKGQLAKSLQNGNNLVRLESFKIIINVFERIRYLRSEGEKQYRWDERFIKLLTLAAFQWLPDLQIILSLRSRFDGMSDGRSRAILSDYLFRVIEAYIVAMPSLVEKMNFDWMKLFPCGAVEFTSALPSFLQLRVFKCLQIIIKSCQHDLKHLLLSSKIVFEIMICTKNKQISIMSRKVITGLMSNVLVPRVTNNYMSFCIREEIFLWIDAISDSTIPTIFKLFRETMNNSSTQLELLGKSWKIYKVSKNMNFSKLLLAAFSTTENSPKSFAFLVGQVTARHLVSLRDPFPLAAVIRHAFEIKSCITQCQILSPLFTYARAIFDFYKEEIKKRQSHSSAFLCFGFNNHLPYSNIPSLISGMESFDTLKTPDGKSLTRMSPMRLIAFTKILNHTQIFSGDDEFNIGIYWHSIQRIVPSILLNYPLSTTLQRNLYSLLTEIHAMQTKYPYPDFKNVDTLITSCPLCASSFFIKMRVSASIDVIYKSRNVLFFDSLERSKLLRIGVLKSNLTSRSTEKIQLSLISDTRNDFSNLCLQFLNCCFGIDLENLDRKFILENELLETAVNAWIWIGKHSYLQGNLFHRRIKGTISLMLVYSLKNKSVKAACLLSLIRRYSDSLVLDICLDFSIEEKMLIFAEIDFLNTILKTESRSYMAHMLSSFQDMRPRMLNTWEMGYLDNSVSLLLRQVEISSEVSKPLFAIAASKTSKRLVDSLTSIEVLIDISGITPLLNLMCTIFDTESSIGIDTHMITNKVIKIFSICNERESDQYYGDGTKSMCCFSMCILNYLKATENQPEEILEQLTSELFCFLFVSLPDILKKNSSCSPTKLPSDVVLTWLIRLINEYSGYLFLKKLEASISQKVCWACLKHGVTADYDTGMIPTLALQFVGLLLIKLSPKKCSVAPSIPSAKEIFDMIVSHSQFKELFTSVENDGDTVTTKSKEHVLKLMITCIMVSTKDIEIKPYVWKDVFASFNAGVSHRDVLIRSLAGISCEDSLPFMDQLFWKGCDSCSHEQRFTGKFDWLVEALDTNRIQATISRFPISDGVNIIISLDDVWAKSSHTSFEQIKTPVVFCKPSSEFLKLKLQNKITDTVEKKLDDTDQYSPAFLLPLVLKTIKSSMSQNKLMSSYKFQRNESRECEDNQEPISPWNFSKQSIGSIQRLCEKGILSFCLASLSSSCEKVRCYSVSILGLILQACHSKNALDSPSWRDRPQLSMLLNSIQRSLVLHKALDKNSSIIPRVIPVVATFLARAAIVLPRPDDALYEPMNRYFLKNETNHGAFQDMKRLPAFMSLFCSSSEDWIQSHAERVWCLQMLRDGIVGPPCYKLVTSCHAPELILSSIENVRLSKASNEARGVEICFLLGSLRSMIDHGGLGAHVHLIQRCGILSWMSSICTIMPISTTFSTEQSRISFCELAISVLERVCCTRQLRSSELIDEMCSLIQPLVSLCVNKCHRGEPARCIYQTSFQTLWTLTLGLQNLKDENFLCPDILPSGISLESSLHLLRITDDSMKAQLLKMLCCLPISLTRDSQEATANRLILLMLDYFDDVTKNGGLQSLPSTKVDADELIVSLLQRISLFIKKCKISLPSNKTMINDIITKIFALRCTARISQAHIRRLWSQCLELLIQMKYNHSGGTKIESLEETVCKEILNRESSEYKF